MKRWAKILIGAGAAVTAVSYASKPPLLDHIPALPFDFDLSALSKDNAANIVPGTEKRLTWFDGEDVTEWAVVALHGFSASRQESAPLAEIVARKLGANLFETRFAGHGLSENGLVDVRAEQWLDDTIEALAIGEKIGRKTIVIGVSTGATLAMSVLDHPVMQSVDSLIMLSPNFAPADPKAMWITWPGGPILLRLISGQTRSWTAHNELQEQYWTTRYPTKTVIEVVRVVDKAATAIVSSDAPRVQIFYSPNDSVVSIPALQHGYQLLRTPQKEIHELEKTGAPSAHIVVGDIISPDNTLPVAEKIVEFISRPTH